MTNVRENLVDMLDRMMAYENGEMDDAQIVAFFQEIVDSGVVWLLQGSYGRHAIRLIDAGLVRPAPAE